MHKSANSGDNNWAGTDDSQDGGDRLVCTGAGGGDSTGCR